MARRRGSADLPLHGGRVPQWLGERMTRLGAVIAEAIVIENGRDELLRRLAHPFWSPPPITLAGEIGDAESRRLHRSESAMGAGLGRAFSCCRVSSWGTEVSSRPAPS